MTEPEPETPTLIEPRDAILVIVVDLRTPYAEPVQCEYDLDALHSISVTPGRQPGDTVLGGLYGPPR